MNEHEQMIAEIESLRLTNQRLEEENRLVSEQRDLAVSEMERMKKLILDHYQQEYDGSPYCGFCNGWCKGHSETIVHKVDCPVLPLRDLESQKGEKP